MKKSDKTIMLIILFAVLCAIAGCIYAIKRIAVCHQSAQVDSTYTSAVYEDNWGGAFREEDI